MNRWTPDSTGAQPYGPLKSSTENGPVDQSGNANTATLTTVTDNDEINNGPTRVNQQRVIPAAVKSRLMQPVSDDGGVILSTFAPVTDGASVISTLTTVVNSGQLVIGEPYWQIFIDTHDANGAMPQSISSKFYPFYTWNSLYDGTAASRDLPAVRLGNPISNQPGKTVHRLQVRNAVGDGSTHLIYIDVYIRLVANGAGQKSS